MYHIDDTIERNDDENHPLVKLVEADNQAHLHNGSNRGDDGDPYPGRSLNTALDNASSPSSKSYAGVDTCVALTNIRLTGSTISARLGVRCAPGAAPRRTRGGKTTRPATRRPTARTPAKGRKRTAARKRARRR